MGLEEGLERRRDGELKNEDNVEIICRGKSMRLTNLLGSYYWVHR